MPKKREFQCFRYPIQQWFKDVSSTFWVLNSTGKLNLDFSLDEIIHFLLKEPYQNEYSHFIGHAFNACGIILNQFSVFKMKEKD